MSITKRLKITIFHIRLHSASSLWIPRSTARFNYMLPTVNVSPLEFHSVSSINLYGASNYYIFSNHLRIRLSPIKSPILLKYKNTHKRNSMYSNISKCNAKSCICCNHLICQSAIISSVSHRQFSVVNNSDLDWKSEDVIYVLTCSEGDWGMQYVGQTKRALKTRFKEHLLKIKKKTKKIHTFLYQYFRSTGHSWSSSKVLVKPIKNYTQVQFYRKIQK